MAKQLNVNLAFQADTSSAEANIRKLQQSLTELSSIKAPIGTTLTKDMQVAVNSAKDLQTHLNNAFNVKTGNFDLKALNTSLKNSGQSLSDLTSGLLNAGLKGEQAFMNVQKAIASSSVQINQAQGALGNFLTTLKNTARWQISSSILHGFMGSIQSAYRYAQDLDKSLNNIRIVTGQNADQMARFAEQANKAAKELSATTTDYTNASLIYYQQGLDDKEVAERTNVTIKMANAAGESAQTVSDQMTAVWNNFAKGGENLEYYADVMTALGAATASSTSEISEGLEKFASVAETVGLSYEYATAALATVTATTRQSADIVGTAFKTLFARIQDLELGETLDDGTTLGQYSQALAAVGVNIKDANGEIKEMDIILEEMASKWNTLAKDQQISLAQSVAGVRQYTQLIALMDNWDFMQENLDTAYGSEGTLQEQADIYAESWEAARDRVRASMETLYNELIPTDFIIDMTDAFGDIIDVVGEFTSAIGGLPTILLLVSNIMLNKMGPSIANTINSGISSVQEFGNKLFNISTQGPINSLVSGFKSASTGTAELISNVNKVTNELKNVNEQTKFFNNNLKDGLSSSSALAQNQESIAKAINSNPTNSFKGYLNDVSQIYNLQGLIEQSKSKLTMAEQEQLSLMQQQVLEAAEQKAKEQEVLDTLEAQKGNLIYAVDMHSQIGSKASDVTTSIKSSDLATKEFLATWLESLSAAIEMDFVIDDTNDSIRVMADSHENLISGADALAKSYQEVLFTNQKIDKVLLSSTQNKKEQIANIIDESKLTQNIKDRYHEILENTTDIEVSSRKLKSVMHDVATEGKVVAETLNSSKKIKGIEDNIKKIGEQQDRVNTSAQKHNFLLQQTSDFLTKAASKVSTYGGMLSKAFSGMSTIAMGISSVSNAFKTLKDEDADFGQKLTATTMGLTMGFNALKTAVTGVGGAFNIIKTGIAVQEALSTVTTYNILTTEGLNEAKKKNIIIQQLADAQDKKEIVSIFTKLGAIDAEAAAEEFLALAKEKNIGFAIKETLQNYSLAASEYAVLTPLLAIAAAIIAVIAAWKILDHVIVTANESLEQSKEQAKEASQAFNDAKNAAQELKSAFDDYKEIRNSLDECIEGTEEWTEALKTNNQEVLKLLQKYPQLAEIEGALDTVGGVTTITDKGMEELQKLADQSVLNTQVASTFSNQKVRNTEIKARKQQLSRDFLGVDIATTDNNSNEDVQALVKEFIADNAGEFANANKESQKKLLNEFFANNNITSDASLWVDAIDGLRPEIAELAAVVSENTAATEAENAILVNDLIGDNEKVNNSQFANEIGKVVADGYDDAVAKEIQALEDSKWGKDNINKATGVNQEARDIFKQYAEAAGITNYDLLDTKGTDKNRKFVYDDGNGEKTVSLEAMKAVVAAANASEKLSGVADKLVTIFNGRSGSDIAAITAASTGSVNDLTLDQLENGFDVEKLANSLSDEDLEALGMTRDEFIDSLNKTIEEGSNAFNDLANDYVKTVSDTLTGLKDSGKLQELTVGETQALADTLNTAFINGGSEATQKISEMFGKTGQDADEFADVLTSVDWQTTNVDDLKVALSAAGVTTHFTAEELQYLIDTLKDTSNASLEAATSQYATLHKIIDGIQAGDTISAEDFNALGEEYRNYFMLMADGTYKLTGDAEEFYKAVNEKTIEDFKDVINQNTDKISNANSALNYGIDSLQIGSSNKDHAQAQINFLSSTGFGDLDKIKQWNEDLKRGTINYLELRNAVNDWTDSLGGAEAAQNVLNNTLSQASWEIYQAQEAIASTATSVKELNQMLDEGTIGTSAYFKAWEALNTKEDLEGLDPEELKEYSNYLQEVTSDMEGFNKEMSDSEAQIVAKGIMKMNDAVETLSENFDGWKDVLKKSTKTSEEYADAMINTREAVSDLLDVSSDYVEDDFIIEHLEDIEKAAKGDAEAIDNLKSALADDIIANIIVENHLEDEQDTILSAVQALKDNIPDIEVGASIDTSMFAEDEGKFLQQCQNIIDSANMTADQANAFFDAIGFEPTFKTELQPVENFVPEYTTETVAIQDGTYPYRIPTGDGRLETIQVPKTKTISKTYQSGGETMTQMMEVPALGSNGEPQIEKITRKASGSSNNFSSSNKGSSGGGKSGGGSGSSNTKKTSDERQSKSDVVERYKEINDQLDITAKKMDDASEIADTLYGSARIKKMREVSKTLQQEISLLEQKNAEAKKYLSQDKTDLNSAASALGIGLSYGANGEITNIEDAQTKLFNQREALLDRFGDTINDSEEKLLEALDKKIETFEKALEQYEDTRELRDELDSEILNKKIEWQENNFDIWEESLGLNLEVNDNALSELERKLEDLEDDFYSMAEAAALMIGEVVDGVLDITGTQLENYTEMTTDLAEKKTELDQKYINGSITQADYIEGLKTLKSEVESNSDNIKNLDDAMIHYYGDTLQAAQEELSQYTDLMSQHIEILEHYVNIMDIIGESTNYKKMGVILEGQAKVAENTMKVSKANYEMLNKQREARKAEYEAAMNSATDEELEVLKQKWLDAETAANDAQDQMMADTEAWAESLKAVLENKLAGFAQELENTLTGEWGSFDQMTAAMDRASSLQEEYLTNTNKIYETNKLMNKAQQDLDKTTNSVAKKRLQAYIDETQQLQDQAELSNYELEIQQAKYDLLLAEIALEEAQAAKSTVRLQRDSEGNFGYVYTADSSVLAQAEQDLEDAQNSLYNIGLEGANDYTQKYQQTLSEMYDSLKELQEQYLSDSFESEQEYNDAVAAAKEYYYEKLKQYSNLYQVALTTDSNVIADAWSSDFNDMIYSTENWQTAVDDYLTQVEGAFTQWEAQIQQIKDETVGPNLEALAEKVEDITTENEELTKQITGEDGLIDALKDEIEQVNNITNAYANQRVEVLALRDANNALITSINSVIAAQANIDNNENSDNENISENNNNNNNNQNSNNNDNQNNDTGDNIDFNKIKIGSEIEVESGSRWYNDSYGAGPTGSARGGTVKSVNIKGSHPYNIEGLGWISKSDIKKINRYNTGGYTGDWGPEGKLGILDEKELVLNKNDTANFLASMEILDKILQAIDLQTLNSQIGGILSSPSFGNLETKTLEQQVTIEANFPGVSVASEIEEAFGNLVNLASQYANRK